MYLIVSNIIYRYPVGDRIGVQSRGESVSIDVVTGHRPRPAVVPEGVTNDEVVPGIPGEYCTERSDGIKWIQPKCGGIGRIPEIDGNREAVVCHE